MTIYLTGSLLLVGLILLISGDSKAALIASVIFALGGFGYRLYSGEEFRTVMADALFVVALFPICWWAAREFLRLVEPEERTNRK
jgi:hypothetical protein